MEINLSNEMIEKITRTAWARVRQLKRDISNEEQKESENYRESAKKKIYLNDLRKSLSDAEDVHELFLELLNQLEEQ